MRTPVLAVGDGALGFWKALAEAFPDTRHQWCWVHKTANVVNALPTSAQAGARKALQEICNAEDREHAPPKPSPIHVLSLICPAASLHSRTEFT